MKKLILASVLSLSALFGFTTQTSATTVAPAAIVAEAHDPDIDSYTATDEDGNIYVFVSVDNGPHVLVTIIKAG